ncbi:MAG: hypothetical protein D6756_08455 [Cyanobacteria bacterium J083]|nr:MAG: hypothetical protein D6756_08455 [Cyanobacteria bacterium J083]
MKQNYPSYIIAGVLIGFLTGCSESKFVQCQKIFTTINSVEKQTRTLANSPDLKNQENWLTAAQIMEKTAQKLENLQLSDPQLKNYARGFAQVYRDNAAATRTMLQAWTNKDVNIAIQAQKQVQTAGQEEAKLGEKINDYCRN